MIHCSFFGGREEYMAPSSSSNRQKEGSSIRASCMVAGPEKEEYSLAFSHFKIGLHKQFLPPHTENKAGVGGKSLLFSSSRVSGNTALVPDPFLV